MADQSLDRSRGGRLSLPLFPLWLRVFFVGVTLSVLLYYSIVPAPGSESLLFGPFGLFPYSMWLHVFAYLGLAVVLAYATAHVARPSWQVLGGVFIVVVSCGVAIELLQYRLPGRTFSFLDMAVNAIGAAIGLLFWSVLERLVQFYRVRRLELGDGSVE